VTISNVSETLSPEQPGVRQQLSEHLIAKGAKGFVSYFQGESSTNLWSILN